MIYFGLFDFANSTNQTPDWENKYLLENLKKLVVASKKFSIKVGSKELFDYVPDYFDVDVVYVHYNTIKGLYSEIYRIPAKKCDPLVLDSDLSNLTI